MILNTMTSTSPKSQQNLISPPLFPFGAEFRVSARRSLPPARSRTGVLRVRGGKLNNAAITRKNRQKTNTQIMQNEPNLNIWFFNLNDSHIDSYANSAAPNVKKNKPKRTQNKPILKGKNLNKERTKTNSF